MRSFKRVEVQPCMVTSLAATLFPSGICRACQGLTLGYVVDHFWVVCHVYCFAQEKCRLWKCMGRCRSWFLDFWGFWNRRCWKTDLSNSWFHHILSCIFFYRWKHPILFPAMFVVSNPTVCVSTMECEHMHILHRTSAMDHSPRYKPQQNHHKVTSQAQSVALTSCKETHWETLTGWSWYVSDPLCSKCFLFLLYSGERSALVWSCTCERSSWRRWSETASDCQAERVLGSSGFRWLESRLLKVRVRLFFASVADSFCVAGHLVDIQLLS